MLFFSGMKHTAKGEKDMVRFAKEDDLPQVNVIRRQVNELHATGRPDIFKRGFDGEVVEMAAAYMRREDCGVVVCERDGRICGFAMLRDITRPESPYMHARRYLDVDEFGVDEGCCRQGVGHELMQWLRAYAREQGFGKLELNMWAFNEGALKFYEREGFVTYRRYMETDLTE